MTDPVTTIGAMNGSLGNILNIISATAGLGTAAMGLVDSTKAFFGGPSNFGFGYIVNAIAPFLLNSAGTRTAFGETVILKTLKANWLNGVAKADQKAKAKSLIHLGLTQGNATALAKAAGVDAAKLESVAQKTANGASLTQDEISVLGEFDAILSAVLDAAYERGDQKYRNACKMLGFAVSTILGVLGGWIVFGDGAVGSAGGYFGTWHFPLSLVVGLAATPLAPVAKDLATSLQAAASAISAVKR
jgi:hypothetical protein